jgi:hypothetical protein
VAGPVWDRGGTRLKATCRGVEAEGVMPRSAPSFVLVAAAAALACEPTEYVEGVVQWRSADGVYGVEYVAPPWELDVDDGVQLRLQVAAELLGVSLEGSPPTHVFTLGPVDPREALIDLLPDGLAELDTDAVGSTGEDLETTGADESTGEPSELDRWMDIDLGSPQQVALVELDTLMTRQDAVLSKELGEGEGEGAPWSFEVVIEPGLFVRGYYFDDGDRTIRAMFASLFTLSDGDVSTMAETIVVGEAR